MVQKLSDSFTHVQRLNKVRLTIDLRGVGLGGVVISGNVRSVLTELTPALPYDVVLC